MKNPARACARRGSVNLSVDAGTRYPAESPSLTPRSIPNLSSGRDRRAQCRGRVANDMAAVLAEDMFSLCVMARDINGRRAACNPFPATFFASGGLCKFSTAEFQYVGRMELRTDGTGAAPDHGRKLSDAPGFSLLVATLNSRNERALKIPREASLRSRRANLKIPPPKKKAIVVRVFQLVHRSQRVYKRAPFARLRVRAR